MIGLQQATNLNRRRQDVLEEIITTDLAGLDWRKLLFPPFRLSSGQKPLFLNLEANTHSVPYSSFGWDLELNPEMGSPSAKITSLKSTSASENQAYSLSR